MGPWTPPAIPSNQVRALRPRRRRRQPSGGAAAAADGESLRSGPECPWEVCGDFPVGFFLENHRNIHRKTMGKWWFKVTLGDLPSGYVNSLLWKIATEIVSVPFKNGDVHTYIRITRGI